MIFTGFALYGEGEGMGSWHYSSISTNKPEWLRDGSINVLLQLALAPHPDVGRAAAQREPAAARVGVRLSAEALSALGPRPAERAREVIEEWARGRP